MVPHSSLSAIGKLEDAQPGITTLADTSTGTLTLLRRDLGRRADKIARRNEVETIGAWKKGVSTFCIAVSMLSTCLALVSISANAEQAGDPNRATANGDAAINDVSKKGIPLKTTSNVSQAASIQAVLIPASLAKRVFGKEVSQNYAVIEVIISNRDSNASLVLHSVFLDYSNWLLSGTSMVSQKQLTGLDATQAANNPSQVASIESRLVRGELLDAQQWTTRNWTMRSLTALGAVAVGFGFPFSADAIKGIAAFNGIVVPGASTLWPDGTVNQINRISDFGFQTNKTIPKQGSDILVAFFPIDRFLTDSFRKAFLTNPAGWFVPYELLADPKTEPEFEKFVKPLADGLLASSNIDASGSNNFKAEMLRSMLADCSATSTSSANAAAAQGNDLACKLQQLINGVSLNNIHVVIEGAMTVEVTTVPATIYSVDFQSGNLPSIWTTTGTNQTGSITGVYLTGGVPAVVDGTGKAIDGVTVTANPNSSTDTELDFTMKVSKCIPPGTKVYFVVNKSQNATSTGTPTSSSTPAASGTKGTNTVPSTPYEFSQQPSTPCPAADASAAAPAEERPTTAREASPAAAPPKKKQ